MGETFVPMLAKGKYGAELLDEARRAFLAEESEVRRAVNSLKEVVWWRVTAEEAGADQKRLAQRFIEMLSLSEILGRYEGALGCIELLKSSSTGASLEIATLECIGNNMVSLLVSEKPTEQYVAGWCLYELGKKRIWTPPSEPDVLGRMFTLWQHSPNIYVRDGFYATIAYQLLGSRDDGRRCASINRDEFDAMFKRYPEMKATSEKIAALMVAWYMRSLNDDQIAQYAHSLIEPKEGHYYSSENRKIITDLLSTSTRIESKQSKAIARRNSLLDSARFGKCTPLRSGECSSGLI